MIYYHEVGCFVLQLDYMQRVLLPEALIMLIRIVRNFKQQQAEAYIQENVKKVKVNSLDYV